MVLDRLARACASLLRVKLRGRVLEFGVPGDNILFSSPLVPLVPVVPLAVVLVLSVLIFRPKKEPRREGGRLLSFPFDDETEDELELEGLDGVEKADEEEEEEASPKIGISTVRRRLSRHLVTIW